MPVGYRFHPTDQELINHYLKLKNQGFDRQVNNIPEIDVCKWEPWDLPGLLGSESDDQEWYFFGRSDSKYGKSTTRSNRATKYGYWKPTGKDRYIKAVGSKKVIGTKKTLVFYKGRNQKAVRTCWVMHEFRPSSDKHNHQAYVLYLLKKKTEETVEMPNADEAELNKSSPSASLLNTMPSNSPSTPTLHQGSANISISDQSRLTQNLKEQEVSSHAQGYPNDSAYLEDDYIDMEALERCFGGQQPTWEGLEAILPAIPLADVYPNQGPIHTTARYFNVLNNGPELTQIQIIKGRDEFVSSINSVISNHMQTPEFSPSDSESGTETDNDVPQSLFGEDAVHIGLAYLSESESSDQEYYNDMILAHEVSLSGSSEVTRHIELRGGKERGKKSLAQEETLGAEISNIRARTYSEVPAQASGKKEYTKLLPKKLESKVPEADSSVKSPIEAKSSRHPEVGGNKSSGMGFIVYAGNPRASNGTTPPSNYIMNIGIGIFLTVVITGEVLFGLFS